MARAKLEVSPAMRRKILDAVAAYNDRYGCGPTLPTLINDVAAMSVTAMRYRVDYLIAAGDLLRDAAKYRSLRVAPREVKP